MLEGIVPPRGSAPHRLGPYRLLGVLGNGRAGTLHVGRGSPQRGARKRLVAVRAVRPELLRDRQTRARLRRQAARVEAVTDPSVAAPLGCELDGEKPWTAAEFAPGCPLSTLVRLYGPLPEMSVRALGGALARALTALHTAGVAHGDVSPGNVVLTARSPLLVECGTVLGQVTARSALGGPETAGGAFPSRLRADDVFGLGVVLALASTARLVSPPGPSDENLCAVRQLPEPGAVTEGLREALRACLDPRPERRPRPEVLARTLDLARSADRPAAEWLPEPWLHEIGEFAEQARGLSRWRPSRT